MVQILGAAAAAGRGARGVPWGPVVATGRRGCRSGLYCKYSRKFSGGRRRHPGGRPFFLDRLGRTMKPQLPECLCALLPDDVLGVINSFVPHLPKPKKNKRKTSMDSVDSVDSAVSSVSRSPDVQRDLRLIQRRALKGMDGMFMRDLDDFVLF